MKHINFDLLSEEDLLQALRELNEGSAKNLQPLTEADPLEGGDAPDLGAGADVGAGADLGGGDASDLGAGADLGGGAGGLDLGGTTGGGLDLGGGLGGSNNKPIKTSGATLYYWSVMTTAYETINKYLSLCDKLSQTYMNPNIISFQNKLLKFKEVIEDVIDFWGAIKEKDIVMDKINDVLLSIKDEFKEMYQSLKDHKE